jgi:hypothetical protein
MGLFSFCKHFKIEYLSLRSNEKYTCDSQRVEYWQNNHVHLVKKNPILLIAKWDFIKNVLVISDHYQLLHRDQFLVFLIYQ